MDSLSNNDLDKIEQLARKVANETSTTIMHDVAKESAKEAVTEVLLVLGIDTHRPLEMQKDFSFLREARIERKDIKKNYGVNPSSGS